MFFRAWTHLRWSAEDDFWRRPVAQKFPEAQDHSKHVLFGDPAALRRIRFSGDCEELAGTETCSLHWS